MSVKQWNLCSIPNMLSHLFVPSGGDVALMPSVGVGVADLSCLQGEVQELVTDVSPPRQGGRPTSALLL
jgi:hypothetical protein